MLENYRHEIQCCTGCGFCKKPYYGLSFCQHESDFPKGKIMVAYGLLSGELDENESVVKILQKCTLCRRCEKDCPSLIKIADIIQAARYDLKKVLPAHKKLLSNVQLYDNILGESNIERGNGKTVFFMGCMTNRTMRDSVLSLFDKLGLDVTVIGGCCGYPLEKIGQSIETKVHLKFKKMNMDKLIVACPSAMLAFRKYKPMHIIQFVTSLNLNFRRTENTYICHDSAYLDQNLNIYDEARALIKQIGNLVEFTEKRQMARWCGGDIEFKMAFPKEAEELANVLVNEAIEKRATIVTTSPHCYNHLKEYGNTIDLLQLVEKTIL